MLPLDLSLPLFDGPTGPDDSWIVLRTLSRQERVVANDLAARRLRHFFPTNRTVAHRGSRKVQFDAPLFSGYLFLRGSLDQAYDIDRSGRIASILRVVDQNTLNNELRSLWIAVNNGLVLGPYDRFAAGRWVEVRSGPLRGLRGRVEARKSGTARVVLSVEMLGRAVSLEIEAALLEIVD